MIEIIFNSSQSTQRKPWLFEALNVYLGNFKTYAKNLFNTTSITFCIEMLGAFQNSNSR